MAIQKITKKSHIYFLFILIFVLGVWIVFLPVIFPEKTPLTTSITAPIGLTFYMAMSIFALFFIKK